MYRNNLSLKFLFIFILSLFVQNITFAGSIRSTTSTTSYTNGIGLTGTVGNSIDGVRVEHDNATLYHSWPYNPIEINLNNKSNFTMVSGLDGVYIGSIAKAF